MAGTEKVALRISGKTYDVDFMTGPGWVHIVNTPSDDGMMLQRIREELLEMMRIERAA